MHDLELLAMRSRNGVYIVGDRDHPDFTMPVVVGGADAETGKPGIVRTLVCGERWPDDAGKCSPSACIAGGPFTIGTCENQAKEEELREIRDEFRENEISTLRSMMRDCVRFLEYARNSLRLLDAPDEADKCQEILDRFALVEKIAVTLKKEANICI